MTEQPSTLVDPQPASRNPLTGNLVWAALAMLALVLLAYYYLSPRQPPLPEGIVWLTPVQAAKRSQSGMFTRLKFRLLRSSGRIWNWYANRQEKISLDVRFLDLPSDAPLPAQLVSQPFTNSDGMRAWILSAEAFKPLARSMDPSSSTALRMTTMEGIEASMYSGSATAAGASVGISPRVSHKHFDLQLNATYTQAGNSTETNSAIRLTNFAMVCRAMLPNGGALVVDAGKRADAPGTNCWLTISCVAIDSKGNPKKL